MKAKLQRTFTPTPADVDRTWYVVDAEGIPRSAWYPMLASASTAAAGLGTFVVSGAWLDDVHGISRKVEDEQDRAARLKKRLASGADFSLTALKESVDPTSQSGGDLPAVARGDLTLPVVEEALFAAKAGDLIGPIPVTIGGREQFHLYKVIERIPPWSGTRAEIMSRLEQDLSETKIQRDEFERWRARMRTTTCTSWSCRARAMRSARAMT